MKLTIILPAFNEEAYLALALDSIQTAAAHLRARSTVDIETIVVDNNSNDLTAAVAMGKDATIVHESSQSVARARNTGARHAQGDVLVFVDADVVVPPTLLDTIYSTMSNPTCLGGAVDTYYQPQRLSVRLYLRAWRLIKHLTGMAQGATQFCRKNVFDQIGGYDEKTWIGEDVDFYWDLKRLAKRTNGTVQLIQNPRVRPSCRRFDKWPMWKILIWTNPLFIALFRHRKAIWRGWYSNPVR